jgi:bifunctional pyridoxal-dependent enzyme with beta-cystathionase and maltose regulon repressor activities
MDFEDLKSKAADPKNKILILSNPHNPVGRVWKKEELTELGRICNDNNVIVVSDEIHFDLILPGYRHVSMGTFDEKYLKNCAICTAPSKTFNLAGLQCSNIFIPNEKRRNKIAAAKGYFSLNAFAYLACIFAYRDCGEWLDELIAVIDGNKKLVENFIKEKLPGVKVYDLQGTYLQWIDFSYLGMDEKQLEKFMTEKAYIFADEGYIFGAGGAGFERINLACPSKVIKDALDRLYAAVAGLRNIQV